MTSAELTEWMAYERIHGPILIHERMDQLMVLLIGLLARTRRPMPLQKFLPSWWQPNGAMSSAGVQAEFERMLKEADADH